MSFFRGFLDGVVGDALPLLVVLLQSTEETSESVSSGIVAATILFTGSSVAMDFLINVLRISAWFALVVWNRLSVSEVTQEDDELRPRLASRADARISLTLALIS